MKYLRLCEGVKVPSVYSIDGGNYDLLLPKKRKDIPAIWRRNSVIIANLLFI